MKKIPVLIVDDSDMDCYLLEREIEKTDIDVVVFKKPNGVEAIHFFEQFEANKALLGEDFPPMIIFLDVNMPLMNGLDFLKKYAQMRTTNISLMHTVVMMFTFSRHSKDLQASLIYDFVKGYLVKSEYTAKYLQEFLGDYA